MSLDKAQPLRQNLFPLIAVNPNPFQGFFGPGLAIISQ